MLNFSFDKDQASHFILSKFTPKSFCPGSNVTTPKTENFPGKRRKLRFYRRFFDRNFSISQKQRNLRFFAVLIYPPAQSIKLYATNLVSFVCANLIDLYFLLKYSMNFLVSLECINKVDFYMRRRRLLA